MTETSTASPPQPEASPDAQRRPGLAARVLGWWLEREGARRFCNLLFSALLMATMVFAATPRDRLPESTHARRTELSKAMRKISLSQTWKMYAPNAARSHNFIEVVAHDSEGNHWVVEEEQAMVDWGTAWFWKRDRRSIWQHTTTRKPKETNRNRTWYMRGICLREARKGREVRRVEMFRLFRRIRKPSRVRDGAAVLGPVKRLKMQDTSCRVEVIKRMVAEDRSVEARR